MEKKTIIPQKKFTPGFFIELNCSFCMKEESIGAATKKELSSKLKEEGWKNIDSDEYGLIGFWCGCNYKY